MKTSMVRATAPDVPDDVEAAGFVAAGIALAEVVRLIAGRTRPEWFPPLAAARRGFATDASVRAPHGEPSVTDFIALELPAIIERFAQASTQLPEIVPNMPAARTLIAARRLVGAVVVDGLLGRGCPHVATHCG